MNSWRKILGLSLVVGTFAVAGCTITTDDDNDAPIGGAHTEDGGTGGRATGGAPTGGAPEGGETSVGGTGGESTGGTAGSGDERCAECLNEFCDQEFTDCRESADSDDDGMADCMQEYIALQQCYSDAAQDNVYWETVEDECIGEVSIDVFPTEETNLLIGCTKNSFDETTGLDCSAPCFDFLPGAGGAGGAAAD